MKRSSIKNILSFLLLIQLVIFPWGLQAVFSADDQGENFLTAQNITVGSYIDAEIEEPGNTDYFKFTTADAGTYTIVTGGCTDTYGSLYDKNYKLIKKNDDGDSGSNNFCITQRLSANQTYYIAVRHYLEGGTGSYTLRVISGNILIQMFNENRNDDNNSISPSFRIFNVGKDYIDLSNIKIRYYYTADTDSQQNFICNSAAVGESNVLGKLVKMDSGASGADYYLELGFNSGTGILESGNCIELQTAVSKADNGIYKQIGDYSFNPQNSDFANWYNVTGYVSGILCWGEEPGKLSGRESVQSDYVDAGDFASEKAHNLKTTVSSADVEENYSVRKTGEAPDAWYSYDLSVPAGADSVILDIRETCSGYYTKRYNIYIDGVLLKRHTQTLTYASMYTVKASDLGSRTKDGKITIKFEAGGSGIQNGPSVADIWVRS